MALQKLSSKKNRRIALIVSACISIVLATVFILDNFFGKFLPSIGMHQFAYTSSSELIEIKLDDDENKAKLSLRIPKSYLTNTINWSGGKQEFVEIQAALPEMRALGNFNIENTKGNQADFFQRKIFIQLNKGFGLSSRSESLNHGWTTKLSDMYGLERYQKRACPVLDESKVTGGGLDKKCRIIGDRELLLSLEKGRDLAFQCQIPEMVINASCRATSNYRNRTLTYTFKRTKLEDWRKIDVKVQALLDGFWVSDVSPTPKSRHTNP